MSAGIRSILNFAPVVLSVPDDVEVRKVDLAVELQILAFHEQRRDEDVAPRAVIEPIRGLPVLRDLIVDMEPFFEGYRSVLPYLVNDEGEPVTERLQSPEERARFDETTKCILCAACTTSCPVFWGDEHYVGPAAIVNAHRFVYDSRDRGAKERLKILSKKTGVFRCRTVFNCTEACPRGIHITEAIQDVKRSILFDRF